MGFKERPSARYLDKGVGVFSNEEDQLDGMTLNPFLEFLHWCRLSIRNKCMLARV